MFESYDIDKFCQKLKEIRLSLSLSQAQVSDKTGINIDTIRKIENGYSFPKYETLAHLSLCYKINLHNLLSEYLTSNLLYDFLKKLDKLINEGKFTEIKKLYDTFTSELDKVEDLKLASQIELKQINYLIQTVSLSYKDELKLALESVTTGLRITIPNFKFKEFSKYIYSSLEVRLLIIAAAILGEMRECQLSIQISKFVIDLLEVDTYSNKTEDLYVIKSLANISYNCHRLDDHAQALDYANKGIEIALSKGYLDMLHFLFLRKAVGQLRLGIAEHICTFRNALYVLKIQGNQENFDYMVHVILDKYNLDFSEI